MAKNKKMYRLFFAVDLEPSQKAQLILFQDSLKEHLSKVNTSKKIQVISPANFHITLSFLGNTSERQLEEIIHCFDKISLNSFDISLQSLIYWNKSAVLALSINDSENKLLQVKKQIENKLSQINFFSYDKKKFEPHITLFRQVEQLPETELFLQNKTKTLITSPQKIAVNEISLMVSTPNQQCYFYDTLQTWPLKGLSVKQQLIGQ